MLNKMFSKLFFSKPTTYCGNKSIILNFDDDSESFTVIQLSQYTSYNFYIEKQDKKNYSLCFEGVLLDNTTNILKFNFDDEDDAEKALKEVLVSLNGKTKILFKILSAITMILLTMFILLSLTKLTMAFFTPINYEQVGMKMGSETPLTAIPPFSVGQNTPSAWGLSQEQQAALASIQAQSQNQAPSQEDLKRQQELAQRMAQVNALTDGNLNAMRQNRDAFVDGGNPYMDSQTLQNMQSQIQQNVVQQKPALNTNQNSESEARKLINNLSGK